MSSASPRLDCPMFWLGALPGPIAYHLFTEDMQEKHGVCYVPAIQSDMIMSALARGDDRSAEIYYVDNLAAQKRQKTIRLSKFSPGEHYYVGREKFDSQEAAEKYAKSIGYVVLPGLDIQSMNDLILAARAARRT